MRPSEGIKKKKRQILLPHNDEREKSTVEKKVTKAKKISKWWKQIARGPERHKEKAGSRQRRESRINDFNNSTIQDFCS